MAVHTVYVGAHAFEAATPSRLVAGTREFFRGALDARRVAEIFDQDPGLAAEVHRRVAERLEAPGPGRVLEDLRVDFEDGYAGSDAAGDASRTAQAAAEAYRSGDLPPGFGQRIHSMAEATRARSLQALDLFTGGVLDALGELPSSFVVTLAKIDSPEEVARLADALDDREARWGLEAGSLRVELMAETPRSIFDAEGRLAVPGLVCAARGRCVGVHFGIYDFTASLGLVATQQRLRHPVCDAAREALHVGLAGLRHEGLDVELSDGSSRVVPRLDMGDGELRRAVQGVLDDVRHSLDRGIYHGWDMAPSHVALRWLGVTAFFLENLFEMRRRWFHATPGGLALVPSPSGERARVRGRTEICGVGFSPAESPPLPQPSPPGSRGERGPEPERTSEDLEDLEDSATLAALRTFFARGLSCGALTQDDLPVGVAGGPVEMRH